MDRQQHLNDLCAYVTKVMDECIGQHVARHARSLRVTRRRTTGRTPAKEHGNVDLDYGLLDHEELSDLVARHSPVFMDDEFAFYKVDGRLIVAPVSFVYDAAVREAGFATEELRACIDELMKLLYLRMMENGLDGFSQREWEAIDRACDLLGYSRKFHAEPQEG